MKTETHIKYYLGFDTRQNHFSTEGHSGWFSRETPACGPLGCPFFVLHQEVSVARGGAPNCGFSLSSLVGGRCEKHVSSLPVTGRRPRSPVGSGLLWVQLRVQIQECQEAAQTHLSQIPIFP